MTHTFIVDPSTDPQRLISVKEVCRRTSLSRTVINRYRNAGTFPRAVKLGEQRIAFVAREIDDWIADRIAQRDNAAA